MKAWVSSEEALALLGVRPQTLYANVSRKRIRVKPHPEDPRRSLYHVDDVRRLAARSAGRPSSERVAAESVSWGSPLLPSAISTVAHGRLWYRGVDAVQLSEHASLEQIASLLWQSHVPPVVTPRCGRKSNRGVSLSVQEATYALLAGRATRDPPMYGRDPSLLKMDAADLFSALADTIISSTAGACTAAMRKSGPGHRHPGDPSGTSVHQRLASSWRRPEAADLIRRALVLLADHELNASTFATRVAASTGAALSACVLAGFTTLSGPRHGKASLALRELVEIAERRGAGDAILEYLNRGRTIPVFGHQLYPDGDIRAVALLKLSAPPRIFQDLRANAERLIGELPNVDFALAALAASMELPSEAPAILFALARLVGWIAHAIEQSQTTGVIRPRARYVGPVIPIPEKSQS